MRSVKTNPKMSKNPRNSQKTGSVGTRRRLRLWLGFMIVFLGWAAYTYISQSEEIGGKSQQLAKTQASKEQTEESLNQFKYEVNRLKDPEYIGQIAMKKYGLYKPGEIPVRVSESEAGNN